jgi:hypothetical protein
VHARFVKWGLAVGLSAVMVVGTAGVGGASSPAKSTKKFCKQLQNLDDDVTQPPSDSTEIPRETAADLERNFKKLSKSAPNKSMKNATTTIADYYGEIADGADLAENAEDFGKAYAKFSKFLLSKCLKELIPDVTLPDITLP